MKELKSLKDFIETMESLMTSYEDIGLLIEMAYDENDESLLPEIEEELKTNYPHLLRGAPTGTAAQFILTQYLGVNLFDSSDFACLQIPLSYDIGFKISLEKASKKLQICSSKGTLGRTTMLSLPTKYLTLFSFISIAAPPDFRML